jgi:hypothetical protein
MFCLPKQLQVVGAPSSVFVLFTYHKLDTLQLSELDFPASDSAVIPHPFLTRTDVPPGVGTFSDNGVITAEICNSTSYDASNSTAWGLQPRPCTACPTNMVTSCSAVSIVTQRAACEADLALYRNSGSGGFVSRSACKTLPGYGWSGGAAAALCAVGTFSVGGHNSSCTSCNNEPANFLQSAGMTAQAQCTNCGSFGLTLSADTSTCGE